MIFSLDQVDVWSVDAATAAAAAAAAGFAL